MSDLSAFTDDQLFEELERRCGQPVRKLKDFCGALTTWAQAIKANQKRPENPGWGHVGSMFADELDNIILAISKSSLLYRLIYNKETLRTKLCPTHDGHWDGQAMLSGCERGCDGTGWLKESADG